MLNIGDSAVHKKTGERGKVIGYGHELVNYAYQTTIKVLVSSNDGSNPNTTQSNSIKEDVYSEWKKINWEPQTTVS